MLLFSQPIAIVILKIISNAHVKCRDGEIGIPQGRELYPLTTAGDISSAADYWLVYVDIPVANLEIETAIGVGAHPRLVVDRGSLTSKVR